MFGFLKKKAKNTSVELEAIANGQLVALESVSDPVFSQKMMGDGFAIEPEDGAIYAPVNGTVTTVFPTQHAIGIESDEGLEILLHLGFNTVDLDGKPFTSQVAAGDQIQAGQVLTQMDLDAVRQAGADTTCVVVLTQADQVESLEVADPKAVKAGDKVAQVTLKG
ncbi:PTS glucose transporter subunit IIA [Aerococcus urinae]|uniref:PTS glucose transporter subunit IIA n=1 Tax=Aerococcus urinae TaxID=1376 RepID=A0A0X8FFG9_9LACT|nr:PTS glucose transporter subunit IIA [Aerococcus urinae]AMB96378.1 PTS glucose transporter subunit IIABC [Aerococcus urinae]MCY3032254.1 PTS glucose transporter subunit IIA [Aerococcus urinae]MCY3037759.1 PTS glucose transporter subunit IIA [Aerococcus urinae]MCY3044300.1 PTS glucose transporter subunit IIA [Aerococcus urinae]MCY3045573.1 PTS glucose transporter subunit IIA [Aerococcus urinae]